MNSAAGSTIRLTGGSVPTYGKEHVALDATRGTITANGTAVAAYGDGAKVVDAWHPNTGNHANDHASVITFKNGSVTAYGDDSFGLDAAGNKAHVIVKNSSIVMHGA